MEVWGAGSTGVRASRAPGRLTVGPYLWASHSSHRVLMGSVRTVVIRRFFRAQWKCCLLFKRSLGNIHHLCLLSSLSLAMLGTRDTQRGGVASPSVWRHGQVTSDTVHSFVHSACIGGPSFVSAFCLRH